MSTILLEFPLTFLNNCGITLPIRRIVSYIRSEIEREFFFIGLTVQLSPKEIIEQC